MPRYWRISGLRRRGYTPEAIRDFCERIGVAKSNSTVDIAMLEHCIREDLNLRANRAMAVLRPLKIVIENYPEEKVEYLQATVAPDANPVNGYRNIPFGREIYIEQEDFMEEAPKKFFRLKPGGEVRLKHAYIIKCEDVIKDDSGNVIELRCSYDPDTKSGGANSGRKVKGTLHWVSAKHAIKAEVRLYDYLLLAEKADEADDFISSLNPNSLEILNDCMVEPSLAWTAPGNRYQFLRQGYFCVDKESTMEKLIFNQVVGLRDSWAKINK